MTNPPKPLIAGNWKMNGLSGSGLALARDVAGRAVAAAGFFHCEVLVCPPATLVHAVAEAVGGALAIGGQDCHAGAAGAHTGDIGAEMLADAGCTYVLVGHSERRADHAESNDTVHAKAAAAHRAGLTAILCVGESEAERDAGRALDVVADQIAGSLPSVAAAENTVIAYEPVWAIGTGRTATPDDIAGVHKFIRETMVARLGGAGNAVRILYGGSVKPTNAAEILRLANVNGALVGGASLEASDFWAIVEACPAPG